MQRTNVLLSLLCDARQLNNCLLVMKHWRIFVALHSTVRTTSFHHYGIELLYRIVQDVFTDMRWLSTLQTCWRSLV